MQQTFPDSDELHDSQDKPDGVSGSRRVSCHQRRIKGIHPRAEQKVNSGMMKRSQVVGVFLDRVTNKVYAKSAST